MKNAQNFTTLYSNSITMKKSYSFSIPEMLQYPNTMPGGITENKTDAFLDR